MYVSANKSRSLISVKASALLQFISPCRSCKCTKYISCVFTFSVNRHSYINYSEHATIATKATDCNRTLLHVHVHVENDYNYYDQANHGPENVVI